MSKNAKNHLYQNLKIIKAYNIIKCVIHVEAETNVNVDCINHDKFDMLITDLHESVEKINKF